MEIWGWGEANISLSIAFKRCISVASLASFSLRCAVFAARASVGSCKVGGIELAQIPRHALLDLSKPALHLRAREILVAIVDRFELAAVDGDARLRQKAYLSANRDELRAHLAYRRPVILAEIGNRFVIRNQPTGEPHHLNVAASLTLKPAARLNPIEITVNVELQQHRRMVRRPAGGLGSFRKSRRNHTARITSNGAFLHSQVPKRKFDRHERTSQAFGKSRLPAVRPATKRFIRSPTNRERM